MPSYLPTYFMRTSVFAPQKSKGTNYWETERSHDINQKQSASLAGVEPLDRTHKSEILMVSAHEDKMGSSLQPMSLFLEGKNNGQLPMLQVSWEESTGRKLLFLAVTGRLLLRCQRSQPLDPNIDTNVGVDFAPPTPSSVLMFCTVTWLSSTRQTSRQSRRMAERKRSTTWLYFQAVNEATASCIICKKAVR